MVERIVDFSSRQRPYSFQDSDVIDVVGDGNPVEITIKIPSVPCGKRVRFTVDVSGTEMTFTPKPIIR